MPLRPAALVAVVAGTTGAWLGALAATALLRRAPAPEAAKPDPACARPSRRRPGGRVRAPARRPGHPADHRRGG